MPKNAWFVIVNPASGSYSGKRKWIRIQKALQTASISFEYAFTNHAQHEHQLVIDAIAKGFRKFISVGGDGTLHHVINGMMQQNLVPQTELKVAVIPLGTGNDWVKTYQIPKNIEKAVAIIKAAHSVFQDIGKISLLNEDKEVFFNNVAGLGFDGYVVQKNEKLKFLGAASFLISTVLSLASYSSCTFSITFNKEKITTRSLLTLVGICQYSGGGMQLTKDVHPSDGLFDISIAKHFSLWVLLRNVFGLFNGRITNHKLVTTYKTESITITTTSEDVYIQADGELIGKGGFTASIFSKAIQVIVPKS